MSQMIEDALLVEPMDDALNLQSVKSEPQLAEEKALDLQNMLSDHAQFQEEEEHLPSESHNEQAVPMIDELDAFE